MWFRPLVDSRAFPHFLGLLVLVGLLSGGTSLCEAARPVRGMVWEPPTDSLQAQSEIQALADFGVQAVRISRWPHAGVLGVMEREGMELYFDLPIRFGTLYTYQSAWPEVDALVRKMVRDVEARDLPLSIGLGLYPFSVSPAVCAQIARWKQDILVLLPRAKVYFETAFPDQQDCHEVVDVVLVDLRKSRIASRLSPGGASTPMGIGSVGTHVIPGRVGLRSPHSPETQARHLESALTYLIDDPELVVFFVMHWKDTPSARPDFRDTYADPYLPSYGLINQEGQPRPSYHVVRQFFSQTFDVFAYAGGRPPRDPVPWHALVTLALWLLLGAHYTNSVRFRQLLPRLFNAPGFYRANVKEARDALGQTAFMLTLVVAVGNGVFWALVYENMREVLALTFVLEQLPEILLHFFAFLQSHPLLLIACFALLQTALSFMGVVGISVFAGRRNGLYASQGLALIGLPRTWVLLLLLVLLSIQGEAYTPEVTMVVILVWLGFGILSTVRTFLDVVSMTRLSGSRLLFLVVLHPTILIALAFLASYGMFRESWQFFRLLLTAF